jgi:hypothetical protein
MPSTTAGRRIPRACLRAAAGESPSFGHVFVNEKERQGDWFALAPPQARCQVAAVNLIVSLTNDTQRPVSQVNRVAGTPVRDCGAQCRRVCRLAFDRLQLEQESCPSRPGPDGRASISTPKSRDAQLVVLTATT